MFSRGRFVKYVHFVKVYLNLLLFPPQKACKISFQATTKSENSRSDGRGRGRGNEREFGETSLLVSFVAKQVMSAILVNEIAAQIFIYL